MNWKIALRNSLVLGLIGMLMSSVIGAIVLLVIALDWEFAVAGFLFPILFSPAIPIFFFLSMWKPEKKMFRNIILVAPWAVWMAWLIGGAYILHHNPPGDGSSSMVIYMAVDIFFSGLISFALILRAEHTQSDTALLRLLFLSP